MTVTFTPCVNDYKPINHAKSIIRERESIVLYIHAGKDISISPEVKLCNTVHSLIFAVQSFIVLAIG